MNWKIVAGLLIVAGIVAVGVLALHVSPKVVNVSSLNGGTHTEDGPHPHGPGDWLIWNPSAQLLDGNGPHPHGPGDW